MEYAIQLLIPVIGGLMLGMWLTNTYHVSPIWTVVLAILGMVAGIAIMYKRFAMPQDGITTTKLPFPPPKKINSAKTGHPEPHHRDVRDLDFLYHKYEDEPDDWKELDELDDQVSFEELKPGQWTIPPKQDAQKKDDGES